MAHVAVRFHGIDGSVVLLETESSNCGENAQLVLRTLRSKAIPMRSIILVQDPTMQRRSCASFQKAWQDAGLELQIANYPGFVPRVTVEGQELWFPNPGIAGLWPMKRFIALVLGEVPRLRDDERGYGPRGCGYIVHVEVPPDVLSAHDRVARAFPQISR